MPWHTPLVSAEIGTVLAHQDPRQEVLEFGSLLGFLLLPHYYESSADLAMIQLAPHGF